MALILGQAAVDCLLRGESDKAVGMREGKIVTVDFEVAIIKKELKVEKLYNLIKILT
jgi:6-phosphofructokinase